MARQVITIHAGEHEQFMPHSWDSQIGKEVPVNLRETDDGPVIAQVGRGRLISAEVAEDGSSVTLTLDVDDVPSALPPVSRMSWEPPHITRPPWMT